MFLEFINGTKSILLNANRIVAVLEEDDGSCIIVLDDRDEYAVTNEYKYIRDALIQNEEVLSAYN